MKIYHISSPGQHFKLNSNFFLFPNTLLSDNRSHSTAQLTITKHTINQPAGYSFSIYQISST